MIRVEPAKEPDDFDEKVRKPGNEWLRKYPTDEKRLPAYWREVHEELFAAYEGYCAYTTFRLPTSEHGVADHFMPKKHYRELAYEWSNYRLAGYHVNSKKRASCEVLDPFRLPEDAFILQADGTIEPNASAFDSPEQIEQAKKTINILDLNSVSYCQARQEHIRYILEKISTEGDKQGVIDCVKEALEKTSRFLSREAQRQGMFPS